MLSVVRFIRRFDVSEEEFNALVSLIRRLVQCQIERQDHPRDRPRQERVNEIEAEAIEDARLMLVL